MLELVTSGRSVAISSLALGQLSARAPVTPRATRADNRLGPRKLRCPLTGNSIGGIGDRATLVPNLETAVLFPPRVGRTLPFIWQERPGQPSCFSGSSPK